MSFDIQNFRATSSSSKRQAGKDEQQSLIQMTIAKMAGASTSAYMPGITYERIFDTELF